MVARIGAAGVIAMAMGVCAPAYAGVSEDFADCDGLRKPKNSDDGMRGQATISAFRFRAADSSAQVIAACTRALESKNLLPKQTLRRAHLLRARAAARLEAGDAAAALTDLDAAEAAAAPHKGDFFFDRSMGLSIDLLRAIAMNEKGDRAAALTLAEGVAAKRPYALPIQQAAALIRTATAEKRDGAIWANLSRIDPNVRDLTGKLSGQLADLASVAAAAGVPKVTIPTEIPMQLVLNGKMDAGRMLAQWGAPVNEAMNTAYALAATGKPDAARAWVAAARSALDAASPPKPAAKPEAALMPVAATAGAAAADEAKKPAVNPLVALLTDAVRTNQLEPAALLVEARIAVAEGRLTDAARTLAGNGWRSTPMTEELFGAYRTAREKNPAGAPELTALVPAERSSISLTAMARDLLISPETSRNLIDYEKSRPNILGAAVGAALSFGTTLLGGIDRTAGFRSTPNPDGTINVTFNGNTTSGPMVQEMVLLRAAEVTREAGKNRFHIAARRDYQRYMTQTQYGIEQNRTLVGYKTELDIRPLDDGAQQADAIDAVAVIDALGPVYYEGKAK
ncbi:hypothetical protein NYR55_10870 [Sphingomonas sp. BGYR3]|uniref:hypothetical protein n=1 Tax=Sphingomonas sp. BGYR3 TaxID=2975483 RepID=UPI0021A704CE|nr:hypothetical protein [Sphingomonas sp. BGYR3]MDG5489115.1 hypothetical protein [Sphingomonas sp. BGYR3]